MSNPLKILTYLTASKLAQFSEGLDVNSQKITNLANGTAAGDAAAYGQLTSLSGALTASISGLSSSVSSSLAAEASARATEDLTFLKTDGTRAMSGALNMGGQDIVSARSASLSGDLTVGGNATITGDLTVQGDITYIASTTVNIGDLNLNLGTGSTTLAGIDGGGIDLGSGSLVQWRYDNALSAWSSNVGIHSDGVISGSNLTGTNTGDVTLGTANGLSLVGQQLSLAAASTASAGAITTGTQTLAGDKTLNGSLTVTSSLSISGSAFTYITTSVAGGLYNVNTAIHDLDTAISGVAASGGGSLTTLKANYDNLRLVTTGTLSSGTATLNLSTIGGSQFATAEIDNIALDIMIDADSTGYTNDLVAVKMFVSASAVQVQIDAPASPSAKYRLIAVNEKDGGLG